MARRKLQAGATGSFRWDKPAETDFPWRYGYYTDTDAPDGWSALIAPDAPWGEAEVQQLRASRESANQRSAPRSVGGTLSKDAGSRSGDDAGAG